FGGEEFLIAMPDTDTAEAQSVADRLRTQVAALEVPGANGKAVAVTLSIGLAVRDGDRQDARPSVARAIDDADKALYGAKTSGRNMVILAGDSLAEVSAA
ncbi:MAG: diguanylate cyclase, partial [Pseudomonadota bacterium]